MECSIAELTDHRYEMTLDPAWRFEKAKFKAGAKHWYEWIVCKNGGIIHLYSEDEMLFKLTTKKATGKKVLQAVKEAQFVVEFHDEVEILFPLAVIHKVARLAKAKRKRGRKALREGEKEKLAEAGKPHRFSGKTAGKKGPQMPQIGSLFEGAN